MLELLNTLDVGTIMDRGAEAVPEKVAVIEGDTRKTYRELNDAVNALAGGLSELGFRKGDRVSIYMKNSVELITAFYALQKLGVIVAWINPNYRAAESNFVLQNSRSKGVFVFREWGGFDYVDALLSSRGELPSLETIIVAGDPVEGEGVYSFQDLVQKGRSKSFATPEIDPKEDLSMFIYTSGTTGKPKGAMITHYAACRAAYEYAQGLQATAEDIFIGVLPMCHSYGCGATLIQPFFLHSTLVTMEQFKPDKAMEIIEKEKVTLQLSAPVNYILELNHPAREKYDLSSLRAGLIAGQMAPEGLITRVQKEMGAYITSFWGASEVGPGVGTMCPWGSPLEIREAYVGKAVPETEVRIVDPENHREKPDGEIGEVTLRGWHMMKGYWENPEETRNQIIDGWLYTGDLGCKEAGGYIKIYGRNKDLINRGGFKIIPSELESELAGHPQIQEVCVVATPNPVLGENICVCVIPNNGKEITLNDLREFLRGRVGGHKLPDELCVMENFPRVSGGIKIKKFGEGGLADLAQKDPNRQSVRK